MISPPLKIGFIRWMSGRCVQSAPVVYGSFMITMSPGS